MIVEIVLFYYTLIVLLVSILAAATCLSAFLVARKRTSFFAFLGFLFYFFDVALVFQDDFLSGHCPAPVFSTNLNVSPYAATVCIAGGL